MKKILSALLVLTLVLSAGIPVLANNSGTAGNQLPVLSEPSDAGQVSTVNFQVVYKDPQKTKVLGQDMFPKEQLTFAAVSDVNNPDREANISVPPHTVTANPDNNVEISIPSYTVPGKYNYTITQNEGNTLGVTYDTLTEIKVQVVVTNNTVSEPALLKQVTFTALSSGKKVNSLVNTYEVSSAEENVFSVQKKVEGNLASHSQQFKVDVLLKNNTGKDIKNPVTVNGQTYNWEGTELTIPLTLTPDASATVLAGIPKGVTYTVTEQSQHLLDNSTQPLPNDPSKGYTATYEVGGTKTGSNGAKPAAGTIADTSADTVVITNTKNDASIAPETGVYLEYGPYVLLLAIAVVGLVIFAVKRRSKREY